uniref:Large ribosomal subunit protein bL20c n=1 Tax=Derbesia sp. WEST4838 TaxID=1847751 RepID=A0A1C9JBJ2_9CHLO|nr:ribosomal protein L20 [Derbesia sp. WEST4838]AOP19218.1 ribosomal protein L20 [Derbesia sp. WEST4838]
MNRIKRGHKVKKKRKQILTKVRGFRGAPNRLYRIAKQQLVKSEVNKYKHRKERKRELRQLWILRLNAFLKLYNQTYSPFIYQLKRKNIQLNRKILSQLSIYEKLLSYKNMNLK